MLGFRGAARYIHPAYAEAFALECEALRRVRDTMGMTNLKVMVPFCRRLDEARRVLEAMARHGLARGQNGLQVYVMCEVPNNVLLIDEFAALFDGFSIGSNDLTQLTLGVDRDSAIVAGAFDERDPGMLKMLRLAVEGARRNGRHSGICGQAPSDHPEIARYLVELGIDSISLTPDSLLRTLRSVQAIEHAQGRAARDARRWLPSLLGNGAAPLPGRAKVNGAAASAGSAVAASAAAVSVAVASASSASAAAASAAAATTASPQP